MTAIDGTIIKWKNILSNLEKGYLRIARTSAGISCPCCEECQHACSSCIIRTIFGRDAGPCVEAYRNIMVAMRSDDVPTAMDLINKAIKKMEDYKCACEQ